MIFTKEIKISKINKNEKDWLIGLFLADGTKYKDLRTYRVTFYLNSLKDYKILEKLELILKKLDVNYNIQIQERNVLQIRIACKNFFNLMPKKNEIYKVRSNNPDAFIAGFLDGDGYIRHKRYCIGFSQTIAKWIGPFISNYLASKGIKPWTNLTFRNCFYYTASLKKVKERTNIINFMTKSNVVRVA